nr:hypothetical protein [Amycolatopsis granulosa]
MGVDEVEWVHNLTPGVISVTTMCPRGHPAVVLTGESFRPRTDPRIPDHVPALWNRAYRHPATRWARFLGRLLRGYEIQRDLHAALYRF